MLPAAIQAEVLRLRYAERWGTSQIARHLGIHRESVRKVALRRSVALVPAPPAPRTTVVTPFRVRLQALLTEDPARPAVTIFQVLRQEGTEAASARSGAPCVGSGRAPRRRRSRPSPLAAGRPPKWTGASSATSSGSAAQSMRSSWSCVTPGSSP